MAARPVVSVVIPAYNTGPYIAETLESALGQTYAHREIIVVDDGSTDDTPRRVEPYVGQIRYIRQENAGEGGARNAGLRVATGDYIAFLDADDLWLPETLEVQLQVAARHPESRMIVCDGVAFEDGRMVTERLLMGPLAARVCSLCAVRASLDVSPRRCLFLRAKAAWSSTKLTMAAHTRTVSLWEHADTLCPGLPTQATSR